MAGPPLGGRLPPVVSEGGMVVKGGLIVVYSCAKAAGAKISMTSRAAVARKIALFIQSSFRLPYLPATTI
jgi:hypothetical protein